jgi:hypothetical protein
MYSPIRLPRKLLRAALIPARIADHISQFAIGLLVLVEVEGRGECLEAFTLSPWGSVPGGR